MKTFTTYIKEAQEFIDTNNAKYKKLKEEVDEHINNTIETQGGNYEDFIDKYLSDTDNTNIEGFINDADIYDFYLKNRNDIDELLLDIKFFDDIPSKSEILGLYDYVILGTRKAILTIVEDLKDKKNPE